MRFFFILSSLGRVSVTVGLLERPLVQGLVLASLTGAWSVLLPFAIILELFWLDCIRLGAVIPPTGNLGYLVCAPLLLVFRMEVPEQLAAPVLFAMLLGSLGGWVELLLRHRANTYIAMVHAWLNAQSGGAASSEVPAHSPGWVVWHSIGTQCLVFGLLYALCLAAGYGLLDTLRHTGLLPVLPQVSLNVWYGLGLLGAVLALRTRRAYATLAVGLVLICVAHI